MTKLEVTYRIITPLHMKGADQKAELRLSSIKAMLRFWYRAIKLDFNQPIDKNRSQQTHEEALFGSGRPKMGRGTFRLQWSDHQQIAQLQERNAIFLPDQEFTLSLTSHGAKHHPDWPGLLASLWLLGQVGSLGQKSRRGHGSLTLTHWQTTYPDIEPYLQTLPFGRTRTIEAWVDSFQRGLAVLKNWFAEGRQMQTTYQHAHIGPDTAFYIAPQSFTNWNNAIHQGKEILKEFGQDKKVKPALGLDGSEAKEWTYQQKSINRLASPIWLRVVQLGTTYVPLFLLFSASFPLKHKRSHRDWPSLYASIKEKFIRHLEQRYQYRRIDQTEVAR